MMKVFLLRHAQAEYGGPDSMRALSLKGQLMARELAEFVGRNPFYAFTEIWCSPFLRARQTAAAFNHLLPDPNSIRFTELLTPGSDPEDIRREIRDAEGNLLLVGHNPHLSILASRLLCPASSGIALPLKKSAMIAFRRSSSSRSEYDLLAYLPPSALGLNKSGWQSK